MRTNEIIKIINELCPEKIQEEWDNSGWQIKPDKEEIKKVLLALEITSETLDEAIEIGADLIITHHPLFFSKLKSLDFNDLIGKFVYKLAKNNIGAYSAHTNFDIVEDGLNDYLAMILDTDKVEIKNPYNMGILRNGYYNTPRNVYEIAETCSKKLKVNINNFKVIGNAEKQISKIAICSGSGAEFIREAFEDGCDLFVTGDVKYHDARNAKELGITVLDIGHYGSEKVFPEAFLRLLMKKNLKGIEFIPSNVNINPFQAL